MLKTHINFGNRDNCFGDERYALYDLSVSDGYISLNVHSAYFVYPLYISIMTLAESL